MTVTAPEVGAAFADALAADAGFTEPVVDVPSPPKREDRDPEAPFGRDADGSPIAPHGIGVNGRPRLKPPTPGAGRPPKNGEKPRVQDKPAAVVPAGPPRDYRADLAGTAETVWMLAAMIPATQAYAALWRQCTPGMVLAWNEAAQQNARVRREIEKLSGDGSWAWVIAVGTATTPLLLGAWELMRPMKDPNEAARREQAKAEMAMMTQQELRARFMPDTPGEAEKPADGADGSE